MIFKIAKAELRNLVNSPVAWFLVIIFLVQCAVFFVGPLFSIANVQDVLKENTPWWINWGRGNSFTYKLFSGDDGIFPHVLNNLYLFIPLLTMGLISREVNSGTIKLLYSSPITVRQIIFGKYLAILLFNALLIAIAGIFMVTGVFVIRSAELGMLLSSALGLYLLVCAYTAIGLFMSTLSNYQIVAAISTFLLIFILSYIGGLWQQYDFIRDLTWFLSMVGRTNKMLEGLLTSKDVIYFLVVIFMFVSFSIIKLRSGRAFRPWYFRMLQYMIVLAVGLSVGYISSRPKFTAYYDLTSGKFNTISPKAQEILKGMDNAPLEITLYTNLLGGSADWGLPVSRNVYLQTLWEPYQRFKPEMKFKYVYYYDSDSTIKSDQTLKIYFPGKTLKEVAERTAKMKRVDAVDFMPPDEIRKIVDLKPEGLRLVMQLKYKGKTEFLRTFTDAKTWPDESNVCAALKRLMQDSLPKVAFISGNLERSPFKTGEREYAGLNLKIVRNSLRNIGFDTDTINLYRGNIGAATDILVIADPKNALSPAALDKIKQYIDEGRNLLIVGEPGKQEILNPVLAQLGVQLAPGTLIKPTEQEMPQMIKAAYTDTALDLSDEVRFLDRKWNLELVKAKPATPLPPFELLMPGVTGITSAPGGPFTIAPLTVPDSAGAWQKQGHLVTDSAAPIFNPLEGDFKGKFATAVQLTRLIKNKQQRIVVCGDADWASNVRGGQMFAVATISWLNENNFPIYPLIQNHRDNLILISGKGATALKVIYVWLLPALILAFATILLIRRKRK